MTLYNLKTHQTKIKAYAFFVGVVLLLVWAVGCKHEDSDDNKVTKAPAPAVVVAEVVQKTVPIYGDFVAQTEANSTVELRARDRREPLHDAALSQPPGAQKPGEVHDPVPAHRHGADLEDDRVEVRVDQHRRNLARQPARQHAGYAHYAASPPPIRRMRRFPPAARGGLRERSRRERACGRRVHLRRPDPHGRSGGLVAA